MCCWLLLTGASRVPILFAFAGITRYNSILNCCEPPDVIRHCLLRFLRFLRFLFDHVMRLGQNLLRPCWPVSRWLGIIFASGFARRPRAKFWCCALACSYKCYRRQDRRAQNVGIGWNLIFPRAIAMQVIALHFWHWVCVSRELDVQQRFSIR